MLHLDNTEIKPRKHKIRANGKQSCFVMRNIKKFSFGQTVGIALLTCGLHAIQNDLSLESVPIFCIILTSSSYIDVIKTVHKASNNILIGVPLGTAASRDETLCIKSTHNTIAVLRPCRLKEKSHKCYRRAFFHDEKLQ